MLLITAALAAGLRAAAISPLARLASATRIVTDGDFSHEVSVSGSREVVELGEDVELDTAAPTGTTIRFTLPMIEEPDE